MKVQSNCWRLFALIAGLSVFVCLESRGAVAAECSDSHPAAADKQTTSQGVPGDRWMETDLYWFDQADIAGSSSCFWDRFAPLYMNVRGDRGLILNIGWTVGYIMEWSGVPEQRISLPAGTGQQPWVKESAPLEGSTEQRKAAWKQRFATPTIVTRTGYGPWTYSDLRHLTDTLRSEAARRGIADFRVGSLAYAWDDAYGEVAPWAKRHPEAFSTWQFTRDGKKQSGKYFDPTVALHQDSTRLGGLPNGIAEGMPVPDAFAAQWGSLSKAAGLDAIMLRDSFGMPVPYQRAGPDGLLEPSPEAIQKRTTATSSLIRETKTANPRAIVMMYSNAASAFGDWRCNGFDLEQIAKGGYLDVWVDQTWAGAWNEVGVRHNSFWNNPALGWTYQLAYTLTHAAVLADTHVKHYPLIETFDAWESWDVLHTVPERLRWGIWAYSHASVKTPKGIKVPGGSYISWANQGKRLLSTDDVTFLNSNISEAVIDAHKITHVYGPTLVYARSAAQWQAEHALPAQDAKEWLDEQIGSAIKWPVPVLSATRIEWLPRVSSDMFLLGAASHLTAEENNSVLALAGRGTSIALIGNPSGGFDAALQHLVGLHSENARPAQVSVLNGSISSFGASLVHGLPDQFQVRQALSKNELAGESKVVYSVEGSPALVLNQGSKNRQLTWDPPEFAVEWDTKLLDIWRGSAAPYTLAAGAMNALLANAGALHASAIDLKETVSLTSWRTQDGKVHLMFGNLEEGLSDDANASRNATIELPREWQQHNWRSVWPGANFNQQRGVIYVGLDQARSAQLVSEGPR